ncbi:MAG: class I SAM-dependent methyltransferase [Myxococcota bacterium]|nr:class I SAM-dependent methyltransferase [Myxococcota bacterium]
MDRPVDCPTCESSTGASWLLEKNDCVLYRCADCTHIFVHPVPDRAALARLYSFESGYMVGADEVAHAAVPPKFVERVERLCSRRSSGRLLDVGCSFGQMLRTARDAGFDPVGVETNPDTAAIARELGFEVVEGELEQAGFENATFDIVHLGDLIEHVPDVFELLTEVRRVLRPDGLLILSTPNHAAFFPRATWIFGRVFGVPWSHATPPDHLHQFSLSSLARLFDRVGFQTLDTFFEPIELGYEIRATGAPSSLRRAIRERRPLPAVRHAAASALAAVGYTLLASAERLLGRDRPRATMTVTARSAAAGP